MCSFEAFVSIILILNSKFSNCLELLPTQDFSLGEVSYHWHCLDCRHVVMIKSRATFSWFYYYFQVLYDGGPPEPPLHVIRVNMKCGKEGKVGGGQCRAPGAPLFYTLCFQIRFFFHLGFPAKKTFENLCRQTARWRCGMSTGILGDVLRREARLERWGRSHVRRGGSWSHEEAEKQERNPQNTSSEVLTFQRWWGGERLKEDKESEESRKSGSAWLWSLQGQGGLQEQKGQYY